jgi:TonB family protein
MKRPAGTGALAVLLLLAATLGCNLSKRLSPKKHVVEPCFIERAAGSGQSGSQQASMAPEVGYLLTSDEGGFSVRLPAGMPPPYPPDPIDPGHEYAGVSFYSYQGGCNCRVNYTATTATAVGGQGDQAVLADRREVVTKYTKPQPVIEQEENDQVQNHPALSIYVAGVGVEGEPEYRRYKFIVANGRVYEVQFSSEIRAELDHPQVNAYFNSFQFTNELDGRVISKPEPDYPPFAKAMNIHGTVVVEVTVDTDGKVIDARTITGSKFLQSAAEAAARKARFAPGKEKLKGVLTYTLE